jgi:tryptophanyl-tRNA synthetase
VHQKKRVFSAVQPSGDITLGNYLGAVKHWAGMQDKFDCIFALADLHAITIRQDPKKLRENIIKTYALFMACGINPGKSIFFIQSGVSHHSQLAWILNCFTPIGDLSRMTQFKDKSIKNSENANAGLFTYPCLMAADILLYDTNFVPVGKDQKQHVEITRNIAKRFNFIYGDVFILPEPIIPEFGAKIMSLKDPTKKMSKSDSNNESFIAVLDEPEKIMKKIMRSKTDSGSEVRFLKKDLTGINNLITILSCITKKSILEIENEFSGKGYGEFKKYVAEAIVCELEPFRKKYFEFIKEENEIEKYFKKGAEEAEIIASKTLERVMKKIGFVH